MGQLDTFDQTNSQLANSNHTSKFNALSKTTTQPNNMNQVNTFDQTEPRLADQQPSVVSALSQTTTQPSTMDRLNTFDQSTDPQSDSERTKRPREEEEDETPEPPRQRPRVVPRGMPRRDKEGAREATVALLEAAGIHKLPMELSVLSAEKAVALEMIHGIVVRELNLGLGLFDHAQAFVYKAPGRANRENPAREVVICWNYPEPFVTALNDEQAMEETRRALAAKGYAVRVFEGGWYKSFRDAGVAVYFPAGLEKDEVFWKTVDRCRALWGIDSHVSERFRSHLQSKFRSSKMPSLVKAFNSWHRNLPDSHLYTL